VGIGKKHPRIVVLTLPKNSMFAKLKPTKGEKEKASDTKGKMPPARGVSLAVDAYEEARLRELTDKVLFNTV